MTQLEKEAANLAAVDILNAAKDFFAAYGALHELEVRLADDGTVSLWLPDGKAYWIDPRDENQSV